MVVFCALSYILFNIAPTFVDIGVAIVYFIVAFNGWFGLIVFVTMALYVGKTGSWFNFKEFEIIYNTI